MPDRLQWLTSSRGTETSIVGSARLGEGSALATAEADICLLDPTQYGVPADVPRERVFRFSRCKARPQGKGGGSAALEAALSVIDRRGLWAVLEASPYPGQDREGLYRFYEKHGFRHNPAERGLMYRPPGGST